MRAQSTIISFVLLAGLQARAGQVNLKDQIGMCLTYDFRQEIPLDKVVEAADSVESVNTGYVLGSLSYRHNNKLKVSFYIEKTGKTVVFYPREFTPTLIFIGHGSSGEFPSKTNLYDVLKELSDMVGIAVDSTPGYCYVPLEDCRNMFIRSSHIILRPLGNLTVRKVFVYYDDYRFPVSINNSVVKFENVVGDYHKDVTSYFLQSVKQKTDLEISSSQTFLIMIFYQEGTK